MTRQPGNEAVLVAEHVSEKVISPEGGLTILSEVSFVIPRGETVAVTTGFERTWECKSRPGQQSSTLWSADKGVE